MEGPVCSRDMSGYFAELKGEAKRAHSVPTSVPERFEQFLELVEARARVAGASIGRRFGEVI